MGETAVASSNNPISSRSVSEALSHADETTRIRLSIQRTRADMTGTIEALQEKLEPSRLKEQVKHELQGQASHVYDAAYESIAEVARERAGKMFSGLSDSLGKIGERANSAMKNTGSTLRSGSSSTIDFVSRNPAPWILIGAGGAIAAYFSMRHKSSRSGSDIDYSKSSSQSTYNPSSVTTRSTGKVKGIFDENPVAVGLVVLAAGAIVGMSLPSTRIEQEYLGDARERMIDEAKAAAHEAAERVQHITEEAVDSLKEAAQREGLLTKPAVAS